MRLLLEDGLEMYASKSIGVGCQLLLLMTTLLLGQPLPPLLIGEDIEVGTGEWLEIVQVPNNSPNNVLSFLTSSNHLLYTKGRCVVLPESASPADAELIDHSTSSQQSILGEGK